MLYCEIMEVNMVKSTGSSCDTAQSSFSVVTAQSASTMDTAKSGYFLEPLSSDGESDFGGSDYCWKKNDLYACRSISALSVMTADLIDFDCAKDVDTSKFCPALPLFYIYFFSSI